MNAFGQIVKIEDVDDMGGQVTLASTTPFSSLAQCWTYIRVSIHDIAGNSDNVVVIGDTFLFSPNSSSIISGVSTLQSLDMTLYPHIQDSYCITHALPQFRCTVGSDLEEVRARNLVAATKSIHT